jgi:hypothetical protein
MRVFFANCEAVRSRAVLCRATKVIAQTLLVGADWLYDADFVPVGNDIGG